MWICIFDTNIHVFGYANMCSWQCQDTGTMNRPLCLTGCSPPISWVLRKHSANVRNVFAIWLIYIRKMFATCWLSVCYILTEQKGGFCIAKVWFLACKKGVFDGQKQGFTFLNWVEPKHCKWYSVQKTQKFWRQKRKIF